MRITTYNPDHYGDVLAIYDSNAPSYFIPTDRDAFLEFLSNLSSPFFVLRDGESALACGGFWFPTQDRASLTWGMVHKSHHGRGFGSRLLKHRIDLIRERGAQSIVCETSQLTSVFFEKHGFNIHIVEKDGFGPGIDKVVMLLDL